jgi:hypothetical protein
VWQAGITRNSIINAVGNVRATEANSRRAFREGRQSATQAKNITDLHRVQVQWLAALANEHAHLCYDFEESELIIHNIWWTSDPTCKRALYGRFTGAGKNFIAVGILPSVLIQPLCFNQFL